jgi:hypothetical protein
VLASLGLTSARGPLRKPDNQPIHISEVQQELAPVLVPGGTIGKGFQLFRDLFIFTDHRLILIDKQGLAG